MAKTAFLGPVSAKRKPGLLTEAGLFFYAGKVAILSILPILFQLISFPCDNVVAHGNAAESRL